MYTGICFQILDVIEDNHDTSNNDFNNGRKEITYLKNTFENSYNLMIEK